MAAGHTRPGAPVPFPTLSVPVRPAGTSRRVQIRYRSTLRIILLANQILECLLVLSCGTISTLHHQASVSFFIENILQRCQSFSFSRSSVRRIHRFVLSAARQHICLLDKCAATARAPSGGDSLVDLESAFPNDLANDLYNGGGGRPPVPLLAHQVSLPTTPPSKCYLLDHLPFDKKSFYSSSSRVLLSEEELAQKRLLHPPPRPFVGANVLELCRLYSRLSELGMVGWCLAREAHCFNGLFAVEKDIDPITKQLLLSRLIIDARPFNYYCSTVCPNSVQLPTPSDLSLLQLPSGQWVYVIKCDVSNFYHHIFVPQWMQKWLCLPPVPARLLDPIASRFPPDAMVTCYCLTLPMGWLHSVDAATSLHTHVLAPTRFGKLPSLGLGQSPVVGAAGVAGVYVDDSFAFGTDPIFLNSLLPEMDAAYARAGLHTKWSKVVPATVRATVLGLDFDGVAHTLRPPPHKLLTLVQATRYIVARRHASSHAVSILLGHFVWFCLLFRPSLSVMSAVYAFVRTYKASAAPHLLWKSVCGELEALCRLAPLMVARLDLPFAQQMVVSDACLTGGAVAAAATPADPHLVLANLHARLSFEQRRLLSTKVFEDLHPLSAWRTKFSYRFRFDAHINYLELKMCFDSFRWLVSHPLPAKAVAVRAVSFVDSQVVEAAIAKGRTSARFLIVLFRRFAASLLATGTIFSCFWIPSAANPSDHPSRHPNPRYNVWRPPD
jgi:hypothetical protein